MRSSRFEILAESLTFMNRRNLVLHVEHRDSGKQVSLSMPVMAPRGEEVWAELEKVRPLRP